MLILFSDWFDLFLQTANLRRKLKGEGKNSKGGMRAFNLITIEN